MAKRADDKGLFKRGRRWWLRLYVPGEGKKVLPLRPEGQRYATTNRDVARAIARDIRRQINDEGSISPPPPVYADMQNLIDAFESVNALGASQKQAATNSSRASDFVATQNIRHPSEVTVEAVQQYFLTLKKRGLKAKTLWNYRGSISRFCEFLIDREWLDSNPCRRLKLPKVAKRLPRWLSEDEYRLVLCVAREHGSFSEVATALYTGMRRSELRRMKWADVDFDRSVIEVPKSKSRRPRIIPMSEKLRAVLNEQQSKTGTCRYVFPGRSRQGESGMRRKSWWIDAMKPLQAALPVFTEGMGENATGRGWHLLRHTFASRLVQAGIPIAKVSAWLGHSDIRTTMVYAHLAPGHDVDIEHA